ncbi:hypothetical protein Tco_0076764, partial [Tanacetum coccineum]
MSSSTVTYTSISSDSSLPPWGFHLMDPYEFEAPQSLEQASPSPDYDQHLPTDASPTALSPGYVADSDSSEEDPEEDPADYPAHEGDDEEKEKEESSEDDEEKEEASKEDKDEDDKHLTPANSVALPAIDHVSSAEETKLFETNESAATPPPPRSPQTRVPFSQTRLCR